jgi:succinate-semialdehyde dehydrogenase/glutarate-semialdehyde dehydrogenase
VIRPASQTPFSALAIGVLAERAGLPKGVCNVVTGPAGAVGGELTGNPLVRKFSFTGSTEVGAKLLAQCAPTIKKTSMELGGNAPFIVFEDADIEAAVKGAIACKYRNAGQTCVCANRILVQETIHDRFAAALKIAVEKMKVGNGMEEGVSQGPLINPAAVEKVEAHVADALAKGGYLITGGHRHALGGNFYQPTIIGNVPRSADIFREETFGPVAPLFRFRTEDEAIDMANDTEFGLAAYFYTKDVGRVFRVAEALEYGIVGINEGIISTELAPFGGVKSSGLGREGSKYGIEDYLEIKYLALGGME